MLVMQQLEFDFESREQKALRSAFVIGFRRGTKYSDAHLSTDNVAERMADEFMEQLKPLPENDYVENE